MTLAQIIDRAYERERRAGDLVSSDLLYAVIDELARRSFGDQLSPEIYPPNGNGFVLVVYTSGSSYRVRVKAPFDVPRVSVTGSGPERAQVEALYSTILSDDSYSATQDTLTRKEQT